MPSKFEERVMGIPQYSNPEHITDAEGNYVEPDLGIEEEVLKQCAGKLLCPILANEVSGGRWRGFVLDGDEIFHEAITSLPYYNCNPVKRLRRAGASWLKHGKFEALNAPEGYFGESKGLIYLKTRLAKTPDELYLTEDGGLIISESASRIMAYNFIERDAVSGEIVTKAILSETKDELETVIKNCPADKRLEAGEMLTEGDDFPTDGYLVQTQIRGRKHFSLQFQVLKKDVIKVGDKLLGLTGLKGIVARIDPNLDADIVVNPNQVYGAKETRKCGAAIKELQKSGRLAVFFQPNQLAAARFSGQNKKPTVSSTAYPFIALYGSEKLKNELLPNKRLADLFYMLDLVLDSKGIIKAVNRQAKPRVGGELESFNYPLWKPDYVKKNIWVPDWLPKTVPQKKAGVTTTVPARLYDAIVRISKISSAEEITEADLKNQEILGAIFRKELAQELVKCISPVIEKGRSNFVAVPKTAKSGEIELTAHDITLLDLKNGQKVLIRREPVVSKRHIQEMVIKQTEDRFQANNTIKITPAAMHLMAGDFDGDPLILMNYADSNFAVPTKEYKESEDRLVKKVNSSAKVDIAKIVADDLYKTNDELVNLAEEEHIKQKQRKDDVPNTGGSRKGASFAQDSIKFELEEIVKYAVYLEEGLKDAKSAEFASEADKKKRIQLWKKARKEFDPALKLLWRKYPEGKLSGKMLGELLGKKFLTNDKSGLYHLLISKIERM
jgi:hypothetical protein